MVGVADLVRAKLYGSEQAAVEDAVRALLQVRPQLRVELAVAEYRDQGISLGRAANLAGVSMEQMKEILHGRGVVLRLGPESLEEAREEVVVLAEVSDACGDR